MARLPYFCFIQAVNFFWSLLYGLAKTHYTFLCRLYTNTLRMVNVQGVYTVCIYTCTVCIHDCTCIFTCCSMSCISCCWFLCSDVMSRLVWPSVCSLRSRTDAAPSPVNDCRPDDELTGEEAENCSLLCFCCLRFYIAPTTERRVDVMRCRTHLVRTPHAIDRLTDLCSHFKYSLKAFGNIHQLALQTSRNNRHNINTSN